MCRGTFKRQSKFRVPIRKCTPNETSTEPAVYLLTYETQITQRKCYERWQNETWPRYTYINIHPREATNQGSFTAKCPSWLWEKLHRMIVTRAKKEGGNTFSGSSDVSRDATGELSSRRRNGPVPPRLVPCPVRWELLPRNSVNKQIVLAQSQSFLSRANDCFDAAHRGDRAIWVQPGPVQLGSR